MGNKQSRKRQKLKEKELRELINRSHCASLSRVFSHWAVDASEVAALYEHFKSISAGIQDDGVIDRDEFQQALGLKDSVFAKRIFRNFDENDDGVINFREFVCGLSILSKGNLDEKLTFSFRIYDIDGDGYIDKEELFQLLKASLFENYMMDLGEQHLRALVDATFQEADINNDGKISFAEYTEMVQKHPSIINNISINSSILEPPTKEEKQ